MSERQAYDVVIAGGGLSGVCAGLRAAEAGAKTLIVEKAADLGGSWNLSVGLLFTAASEAALERASPGGDPDLGRLLVGAFERAREWLGEVGVPFEAATAAPGFGPGYALQPPRRLIEQAMARYQRLGGEVRAGAIVTRLAMRGGAVDSVSVKQSDDLRRVGARAVVLCTGGFSANPELLTRYVGRWGDRLVVRSHVGNTGDGLEMGLAAGAAASRSLAYFYGHLLPAPPAQVPPALFRRLTFPGSIHAVVVNQLGERFTDESISEASTNQELGHQPEARGVLLFDARTQVYECEATAGPSLQERLDLVREVGGRVAVCPTLEALAATLAEWGTYGPGVLETLATYNAAVRDGAAAGLPAPRRRHAHGLTTAPFYAVPVVAAVTVTKGGLRVDAQARVLDRQGRPIAGLYAAGADAGGVFQAGYAGAGAWAIVSAMTAGTGAAVRA